jgi:hypothetical protein
MAKNSTNSTIITIAVVVIVAYVAFRWINGKTTAKAATSGGYVGGGSDSGQDYYAPYETQTSTDPLSQIMSALGNLLSRSSGGKGSGSGSGFGNNASSSKTASGSSDWSLVNILGDLTSGFIPGTNDLQGDESNPAFGGDSLFTASTDSTLYGADNSIPYEDANLQLPLTGTDYYGGDSGTTSTGDETVFQIPQDGGGGGGGGGEDYGDLNNFVADDN